MQFLLMWYDFEGCITSDMVSLLDKCKTFSDKGITDSVDCGKLTISFKFKNISKALSSV